MLDRAQNGKLDTFAPKVGSTANELWASISSSPGVDEKTLDELFNILSQDDSFTLKRN